MRQTALRVSPFAPCSHCLLCASSGVHEGWLRSSSAENLPVLGEERVQIGELSGAVHCATT